MHSDIDGSILACPYCHHALHKEQQLIFCPNCNERYPRTENGPFDLRLKRRKSYSLEFELGTGMPDTTGRYFGPLPLNPSPEIDFRGMAVPRHLKKELLSYFPKARNSNSRALDLGCGNALHRKVCELAGFRYVGLDYESPHASMLGDAHALPFKDESFDFVLSIAVLEHIRFPFVMMREVHRVLKNGGTFIGTVAFLEPFHGNSFYHHTHLGALNSLQHGGFNIEHVAASEDWSVLTAQASMALFPKMPRSLSRVIVMPLALIHRLWWRFAAIAGKADNVSRICKTTGVISFVATKDTATISSQALSGVTKTVDPV